MARKSKSGPSVPDDEAEDVRPTGSAGSYDDWSVDDLRERAKELGLSGYSGKKKAALVEMLRSH